MRKLSQKDLKRIAEEKDAIDEAKSKLEAIIEEMKGKVAEAISAVNDARDSAYNALDDIVNEAQSYYDEKSEKWQEGDNGQQYQEWIGKLEEARDAVGEEFELDLEEAIDIEPVREMIAALEEDNLPEAPDSV